MDRIISQRICKYEVGYGWDEEGEGERTYCTLVQPGKQEVDYSLDHVRERFKQTWANAPWSRYRYF